MNKNLKLPLILGGCMFLFSFIYGGLYTEMYLEGLGFSFANLIFAIIGSVLFSLVIFVITLVIVVLINNLKKSKTKQEAN